MSVPVINNAINNTSYGLTVSGVTNINSVAQDSLITIGNSTSTAIETFIYGGSGFLGVSDKQVNITAGLSDGSQPNGNMGLTLYGTNSAISMNSFGDGSSVTIASNAVFARGGGSSTLDLSAQGDGSIFNIHTVGAASDINIYTDTDSAGSGDINISAGTSSNVNINAALAINIGTNNVNNTIVIGNNNDSTNVEIRGGSLGDGAINIGTSAYDQAVNIGNTTGASPVNFQYGSGGMRILPLAGYCGVLTVDATGYIAYTNNNAGYVLTSRGLGLTPIFSPSSSFGGNWNVTVSTTMVANNGYIANDPAGLVTLTLPATIAAGSMLAIQGFSADGWTIAQNSGQTIFVNGGATTTGVTGSVSSINQYDSITILCVTDNTDFVVYTLSGNLTFA